MTKYNRQQMVELLERLYSTMSELSRHFYDVGFDIDAKYPFHVSFDELTSEVGEWMENFKSAKVGHESQKPKNTIHGKDA